MSQGAKNKQRQTKKQTLYNRELLVIREEGVEGRMKQVMGTKEEPRVGYASIK